VDLPARPSSTPASRRPDLDDPNWEINMPTFKISRRTVLRGTMGGAAVAFGLPPLEAMFNANGTAYAQGAPLTKRMGIFFWGGGVKHDRWTPATTGSAWTPSLA